MVKRPQGFERQVAAGQRNIEKAVRTSPEPTSRGASGRGTRVPPVAEAATEPIVDLVRGSSSRPQTPIIATREDVGLSSDRADRRAVAKAKRRRQRFERSEVQRFTRRSRRRTLTIAVALGSAVLLVAAVVIAAFSPLLSVRTISVEGTSRVDAKGVESSLSAQFGVPLALVDGDSVARSLAGFPLIRSYSLEASPPSTLIVRIVERTPIGVLQTASGFDLVDAAGVVIETGSAPQAGFPVVTTPSGNATGEAFGAVARVVLALPISLSGQISAASATTPDDVTLTLVDGGKSVVWGSADDSALKAVVLAKLIAGTDPSLVTQYDVSSPTNAVVR